MGLSNILPALALFLASCGAASHPQLAAKPTHEPARDISSFVEGRPLRAPTGYLLFCLENPGDCKGASRRLLPWSSPARRTVQSINAAINRTIVPASDPSEVWSASVGEGDCEDYALTKRRALIQAGLPASSLRMAVATTSTGEMHAVLVVKTSSGDFILDNRNDALLPPRQTDLRWIKMASAEDPRIWHTIQEERIRK